jgi:hypothetical protein
MRTSVTLLVSILLVGLALTHLQPSRTAAQSGNPTRRQATNKVTINATNAPAHPGWRLGAPVRFDNLTVFPVVSDDPASAAEFITLDEGLRSGKIKVTELDASGRTLNGHRRTQAVQANVQSSGGAEVNRLAVTNNSGKKLILIAGEMVIGGKQDRIVGHDCIIEATNKPVPIDVFCVEHGRWSGEAAFGHNTTRDPDTREVASRRRNPNANRLAPRPSPPPPPMALPKVRGEAQATKDQSGVWAKVAETASANNTRSSTGDLKSVYQDKRVTRKLDDYERALKDKLSASDVVGIVAAVNGRIISADVFANHALFQAYWPKMLKSYALEAVSSPSQEKKEVERSEALTFLARVQGTSADNDASGVYRLVEHQSSKDASFELESSSKKLLHFNRVSKQ